MSRNEDLTRGSRVDENDGNAETKGVSESAMGVDSRVDAIDGALVALEKANNTVNALTGALQNLLTSLTAVEGIAKIMGN